MLRHNNITKNKISLLYKKIRKKNNPDRDQTMCAYFILVVYSTMISLCTDINENFGMMMQSQAMKFYKNYIHM